MYRSCIFCIYQKNSHLPRDVEYLIRDLKSVLDYLVIVVNGDLVEIEALSQLADKVIQRVNTGFDAGAYKFGLHDADVRKAVLKSDELILCNDTFYGPFVPFCDIFQRFEKSSVDFWGLRFIETAELCFLQSFFYVFRKRILDDRFLDKFFNEYNEHTLDFNDALFLFERKIFNDLVSAGYVYDYFYKIKYCYLDADVIFGGAPVLKKKQGFDINFALYPEKYDCKKNILNILRYLFDQGCYDVKMIIDDIKARYAYDISVNDIEKHIIKDINTRKLNPFHDLKLFARRNQFVYIYGMGSVSKQVVKAIGEKAVKAFIISDNQQKSVGCSSIPVFHFSEIEETSIPIIVALGKKNTEEVKAALKNFTNLFYIAE